jgi:hypothetical protein
MSLIKDDMKFLILLLSTSLYAGSFDESLESAKTQYEEEKYLDTLNFLKEAKIQAWQDAPLTLTNFKKIKEPSKAYSVYEERHLETYVPTEPVHLYCEPVGYLFSPEGEFYSFGVSCDAAILDRDGNLIAEQKNFGEYGFQGHQPIMEFALSLTMTLEGLPADDYQIQITAHDLNSDKTATATTSLKLKDATVL